VSRRVCEHTGAFAGESIGDAIRRHIAWITLAQRQRDQDAISLDPETCRVHLAANREVEDAAQQLLTLSLEVDAIEARAQGPKDEAAE
jgi:hypothetical protein